MYRVWLRVCIDFLGLFEGFVLINKGLYNRI